MTPREMLGGGGGAQRGGLSGPWLEEHTGTKSLQAAY